jgi:aryl-alcohol dehydrogenase-like predicted oxidoreductase
MWGGTDEAGIARFISAIDRGITLIDSAPVYGFGKSEEIVVGTALASHGLRRRVSIATKLGLGWTNGEPFSERDL